MNVPSSQLEARQLAERRSRQRIVLMVVPALAGSLITLWAIGMGEEFFYRKAVLPKEFFLTLGLSLVGISGLAAVMTYLQTGFRRSEQIETETLLIQRDLEVVREAKTRELEHALMEARTALEEARESSHGVQPAEREAIVHKLKADIEAEAKSRLHDELRDSVAAAYSRDRREKELLDRMNESRARLMRELDSLSRRGNLNLALGAVTTIVGLVLLGLSVFSELSLSKDLWTFVSHFVPRLTLVLMIELFAYFFLSLYKGSLSEIKYFQNELTNVEARQMALRAAIDSGDQAATAAILTKLADTDRNHILTKDQTTVELEKVRIEREGRGDLAKYLSELFAKKA
jgi:hypothetical protein